MKQRLRMSWPPVGSYEIQQWVLNEPEDLALLRQALTEQLVEYPITTGDDPDSVLDALLLAATELAGRAVARGKDPTVVTLMKHQDMFILDVGDQSLGAASMVQGTQQSADEGLSLAFVERFSQDLAWYDDGDATHVWAELGAT
ncbi:hypothetical protein [Pilimelia terevasa]|nr:hypothetical protein [Pilimelia terevasa]